MVTEILDPAVVQSALHPILAAVAEGGKAIEYG